MFLPSAALVLLTVFECCTYSVGAVHHVNITFLPNTNTLIPMTSDQNVTYNCSISEGNVVWQVNDYQLIDRDEFSAQEILIQEHEDGDFSEIVLKPNGYRFLSEQFGATPFSLQCLAVVQDVNVIRGETQTITVYGSPSPPTSLSFTSTSTLIVLQWNRPTSMSTSIPLNYTVSITNTNTNETVCEGTVTDTSFECPVPNNASCQIHSFSVASVNSVGTSDPRIITDTIPPSLNISRVDASLCATVDLRNSSNIKINISSVDSYTYMDVCSCPSNGVCSLNYNATVDGREGYVTDSELPLILSSMDFDPPLTTNAKYIITIMVCNSLTCQEAEPLTRYTTHVQSATVTFFNESAYLNCTFASSSSATGCLFVFSLPNGNETFTVSRTDNSLSSATCVTTRNTREAYTSIEVYGRVTNGGMDSLAIIPSVREGGEMESITCKMNDIQNAEVKFYQTTVLLECSLISGNTAQGCHFLFSSAADIEAFSVTNTTDYKSCNRTKYERESYTSIKVYVILSDGNIGSEMVTPSVSEENGEPCPLDKDTSTLDDDDSSGLSAGAAAALAVVVTALVVFVLGAAFGGLVVWCITKKKMVSGGTIKPGGEFVLEQKTGPHEGGELEEQKD